MHARTKDLAETQLEVVLRLARAAELHDDDTGEHIERMSRMCGEVALELGLPGHARRDDPLRRVLHDVGKIGVPDDILRKPGRLTADEMTTMRRHVVEGALLLEGSPSPVLQVAEIIVDTHHERWDGTGYPNGLTRRGDPARGPDRGRLRRLRRAHQRASLQARLERRARLRGDRPAARHALRPRGRRRAAGHRPPADRRRRRRDPGLTARRPAEPVSGRLKLPLPS